ncbi:Two-component response regulator, AmiR/NasT family, consists of REC and RNA-binding antiterminator (ANTAR) domains [Pseudorhodobacter antarcticus]|uniref:Two-component response regulator, AmiR/NasT family, consists of REC and RNA-binding antiterminator (ANTAR) domains n=1 Tax=Pseudorhodobacter antarcticus TaxID=1077947 RepID=A0A1H8K9K6_9RHOB|nr:ANTAR domain-containing protein [Pseudorhodobacter antarcticus]SEN89535.1 Two-component response regulator, AmiR/NasT family, consists of REC and RNA-binding antiterminator (ANTAR) domains [Pseudorhodobacter antarcticus]
MKQPIRIQNLGGARALILHRAHPTVVALTRQLTAIGLEVRQAWPEGDADVAADASGVDFVFFDADMGHDGMFPWPAQQPPVPLIALIGSEAPGRIEWALRAGAQAQLLKPVGDNGAYSALLIARDAFDAQRALFAEVADLRRRLNERQTVVRAVTMLMARGKPEAEAYGQLRQMAMAWRISLEDAAGRIVGPTDQTGGRDDRRDWG